MLSTVDLQERFSAALFNPRQIVPPGVTSCTSMRPVRRFNVYRNNVFHSLSNVLEAQFPVVKRLLGVEFFRAVARAYIREQPPQSPVLMEYGAGFAGFLEAFDPVSDDPYLPDVARLEWLQNEAFYAEDAVSLTGNDLAPALDEDAARLTFECHPSLGLLTSQYPVVDIWQTNTHEETVREIDAMSGGEDALVMRPQFDVSVVSLPPGSVVFFKSLRSGSSLGSAFGAALERTDTFDVTLALALMIDQGVVVSWSVDGKKHSHGED